MLTIFFVDKLSKTVVDAKIKPASLIIHPFISVVRAFLAEDAGSHGNDERFLTVYL